MATPKLLFQFILLFSIVLSYGQDSNINQLVKQGIELHDNGQFKEAIEIYKNALLLDPNSSLVNYELALSYTSNKDYVNAEKYSKKVIDLNNGNMLPGYIAYANSLDLQGKPKKAIKIYEKAIKEFDHYLLLYNYAFTCLNIGEVDKAYDAALKAIKNNPLHGSSHLILSEIMTKKGERIKAMLPLYYFLLIEPNSSRSANEYAKLRNYMSKGVTRTSEKDINVVIPTNINSDFAAVEMMISLVNASNSMEENKEKSDLQLFFDNNKSIFSVLGELKKDNTGFWWDFYVTFFYKMVNEDQCEAYSYYISLSKGQAALDWIDQNQKKYEKFKNWMK